MSTREEWAEQFNTAFPEGVRCELVGDGGWLFHAPYVLVEEATPQRLVLILWQMDTNGELPLIVSVRPPTELTPPEEELQVLDADLPSKLTMSSVVPEDIKAQLPSWSRDV